MGGNPDQLRVREQHGEESGELHHVSAVNYLNGPLGEAVVLHLVRGVPLVFLETLELGRILLKVQKERREFRLLRHRRLPCALAINTLFGVARSASFDERRG